jgi:hypothetical protein
MRTPKWVGERQFVVLSGPKVVAAFFVKERAESYAEKRGLEVKDLSGPG